MACYHPLKAWPIGTHPSGKTKYKITSYDVQYLIREDQENFVPCFSEISIDNFRPKVSEFIEIPCGQCIGCRLKYSRMWADRCMLELKDHDKACFLTLTYNDEHLPEPSLIVDNDGVVSQSSYNSLNKRDLQLFIKRLRKAFPEVKCRYYAVGEYSPSFRPHYHLILYGVDFSEDRKVLKRSFSGDLYYVSEKLEKLWSDPESHKSLGYHIITDVTWDTCAYVARYCTKKLNGAAKSFYDSHGVIPEFAVMSRRPGIARNQYNEYISDIYRFDSIQLSTDEGGRTIRPPRYYDQLFDIDYPERSQELKEKRRIAAEEHKKLKLSLTSLNYLDMLKSEEEHKLSQISALKRKEL